MGAASPLASLAATRKVLNAHGLAAKHALGQNFLVNDGVIAKILNLSGACEEDMVLEVGPGIGTLTTALLPRVNHVISVERDPDLIPVLGQTCAEWINRFTLLNRDAMGLTTEDLRAAYPEALPNKLIANLPYVVATALVLDYFTDLPHLDSATVMVQKEVAQRMMAVPGTKDYGAYSVKLQLRAKEAGHFLVKPASFFPPPKVDSMVIRLDRTSVFGSDGAPLSQEVLQTAEMLADAAFAQRRKTLSNSVKGYFSGRAQGEEQVEKFFAALDTLGIERTRRGETLSVDEFVKLAELFVKMP